MEPKPIKDAIVRRAVAKVAVYAIRDGYIPDENGVEKKRDIKEWLYPEEYMAVEPYINEIIEVALGFPHSNEIQKPRSK